MSRTVLTPAGRMILAALVVAGCSRTLPGAPQQGAVAPGAGASVDAVIAFVEAGNAANRADFAETEESEGTKTQLGSEVAFRSPRDLPPRTLDGCISYDYGGDGGRSLSCLADLRSAPHRPNGLPGQWIGNWVEYNGAMVTVGGLHGDPGPFNQGRGKPLPYGDRIRFEEFQCRSDPNGLYCVNYPHHSAVLLGDQIITFGCRVQPDHPRSVGERYDCGG